MDDWRVLCTFVDWYVCGLKMYGVRYIYDICVCDGNLKTGYMVSVPALIEKGSVGTLTRISRNFNDGAFTLSSVTRFQRQRCRKL